MLKALIILLLTSSIYGAKFSLVSPMVTNAGVISSFNTTQISSINIVLKSIELEYKTSTSKYLKKKKSTIEEILKHQAINSVLMNEINFEVEKMNNLKANE